MKKKKMSNELLREALDLVNKMETLRGTVEWLLDLVEKYDEEYSDDMIERLSWEEKEEGYKKIEELMGRVESLLRELEALDVEYDELREKVKNYYGTDRLPPIKGVKESPILPDEEIGLV